MRMTDKQLADAQKAPNKLSPWTWLRVMNAERKRNAELERERNILRKGIDNALEYTGDNPLSHLRDALESLKALSAEDKS